MFKQHPLDALDALLTVAAVVQTIGGAFLVSAGQSAFEAKLTKYLVQSGSNISPLKVIGTGATAIRTVFKPEQIPTILRAYVHGIQTAFIVSIALAASCTILAFATKWKKMQAAVNNKDGTSNSQISEEVKLEV